MQLSLSGHHVEVTPSMRAYVEKKLERISRHFDHVIDVHCVLTVEKLRQKAEATLHVRGNAIHADATEENMYTAIDLLADKLDRRVLKHKEMKADKHAAEARKAERQSRSTATCGSSSSAGCRDPARAWLCTCSKTPGSTAWTTSRRPC